PHTPCRSAPTPTWCSPDSENVRHADANLETSTGHMAPYGHTGRTANSGSNMSCRPSGQTLRKSDLRRIPALSTSLNSRTTCTRYRDTTCLCAVPIILLLGRLVKKLKRTIFTELTSPPSLALHLASHLVMSHTHRH